MRQIAPADIAEALRFYEALGVERLPLAPVPDKAEQLAAIRAEIGDCTRCKLSSGRTNIVFGEGSPRAEIMFVGEGPGRDEDLQGRPFVGKAGELLTSLINRMGFEREEVYIGNIVKCRPPMNRDPEEDEVGACLPFIKRQIMAVRPRVVISLGRIALHALTGQDYPITKTRGRFLNLWGLPLMPTFHPAYLLRNPKDKFLVWEDALAVLKKIGREPG